MYARRNLFRRMCRNIGRIGGIGNSSSLIAENCIGTKAKQAGSRNVICLIFVQKGA